MGISNDMLFQKISLENIEKSFLSILRNGSGIFHGCIYNNLSQKTDKNPIIVTEGYKDYNKAIIETNKLYPELELLTLKTQG